MSSTYSDEDLDAAVAAGVLTAPAVEALRSFVDSRRQAPAADEEAFRLLTGFNDIFVAIAIIIVLAGVALSSHTMIGEALSAAAVAAVSWPLAEFFTRRRRMALPSILLLLAWVGGWLVAVFLALVETRLTVQSPALFSGALLVGGAAVAYVHWLRFRVPITVAAGVAMSVAALAVSIARLPNGDALLTPMFAVAGLATLGLALWWDSSDPMRRTRRADVAFWLHIAAAPMIVHPIFAALRAAHALAADAAAPQADYVQPLATVAIYLALAMVSLIIDRRALMVSGLIYLLVATTRIFGGADALSFGFAIAALVAGSALLLLSAFWRPLRGALVGLLPAPLKARLPPA